MSKFKAYLRSFRLRTLPLSVAGIVLGTMLAASDGAFHAGRFALALLTVLLLQILSNVANELGDTLRGTDSDERQGMVYSLQSGEISIAAMKRLIVWLVALSALSGVALVATSFEALFSREGVVMLVLGALAIVAALGYTLGRHPYGYMGLGDLFVFLFFGLLSTIGGYFLMCWQVDWRVVLPASACGLWSVGVLNINNIRDMESDRKNRVTIPILLGERGAKIYQCVLELLPFVLLTAYCHLRQSPYPYAILVFLPLYVAHLYGVMRASGRELDPRLPQLSLLTIAACVTFGVLQLL
ncbi:MAG: 1,4-dihydroxy-2-naphthoate octaprenyltransferase [Rikenellaceae bacterium]|nr:1,4-dihydroxy-2-naphthoate octaprenyltransferase [Rikenellaceae bacterium]